MELERKFKSTIVRYLQWDGLNTKFNENKSINVMKTEVYSFNSAYQETNLISTCLTQLTRDKIVNRVN
jgi:hypothetical protein